MRLRAPNEALIANAERGRLRDFTAEAWFACARIHTARHGKRMKGEGEMGRWRGTHLREAEEKLLIRGFLHITLSFRAFSVLYVMIECRYSKTQMQRP